MKYQVYKRADGREELRLKPESERDCHEIEDCSKCFLEDDHACDDESCMNDCVDDSDIEDHINKIASRMIDPSIEFGITPKMMQRQREPTFEEILEKFGFPGFKIEGNANRAPVLVSITDVRTFKIEDGKVMTDPETRELMRKAGILDKIEKSFEEEDEN